MKILVGCDGSQSAFGAFRWATSMAKPLGASVLAVNVYAAEPALNVSWEQGHERALRQLREWCRCDRDGGIRSVETMIVDGEVGPALLATAEHQEVDLIVLGRRGAGGFNGLLIGSAADYIAHYARQPLAILPPEVEAVAPRRILLGLDGARASMEATRWVARVAPALGAKVVAGYVAGVPEGRRRLTETQQRRAERWLDEWCERLGDVVLEKLVRADRHAADALLAMAADVDADLLVIGTRAIGGLRRIRLGGVTLQLLHHSPVPVIAVPPSA